MSDHTGAPQGEPSKGRVFISYSRKDMAFADWLEAALKARGFEPLIDRSEIYAFEDWWARIESLIARADTVVFVLSPDAVASEVALKEVAFAASLHKRFAPIICRAVSPKAVPEALARLNFIAFEDPERFEESAHRLAEALDTDIVWIRQHTDFGEQARRWVAASRPNGLLLRSPLLEQAERWIASRPPGAPAPTEETQAFIRRSRQTATRRRNILTGALAAGLVLSLALAGLAYWQRGIAIEQRTLAERNEALANEQRTLAEKNEALAKEERDKATRNFKLAQKTADSLVTDIAQGLRNVQGLSAETVRKILETARATFEQLTTSAPDDLALQRSRSVMLNEFGDTYLTLGNLDDALQAYRDSLAIAERLAAADRSNAEWQRDLSISYNKVGNVLVAQGKLEEALKAHRDSLAIVEPLAAADGRNTQLQRDLSVSYEKVGDVLRAQGRLDDALKAYRDGLGIAERLAAADSSNTQWQRDLSVSYEKVGDVLVAQDNFEDALKAYLDGLAIRERLAAADPSNTQWQRDLFISYIKIGDVLVAQGKLEDALKAYRDGLAMIERLAAADHTNTQWQRDLSVSYNRIGNMLVAQGKFEDALRAYLDGLAIRERLAAADRSNRQWQRDLSVSYDNVGDVLVAQGKLEDALEAFRNALAVRERLAAADPSNTQWQRDLWVSFIKVGDVLVKQEWLVPALKVYTNSLAMAERLTSNNKEQWRTQLRTSIDKTGGLACRLILARDFSTALEAVNRVIQAAPEEMWLYSKRAHALMFLGRAEEARALYLQYRTATNVVEGKTWPQVVLDDFADLRKGGLVHPLMDEIEKEFASGG
jgi:tetratricopeptide (TPR) repeat protein